MDCLDKYSKYQLGFKHYGRYVDDFFMVDIDKQRLKNSIDDIRYFLKNKLNLTLHPSKIHLQHFNKGIGFLGAFIKPYRAYPSKRIKNNFYQAKNNQQDFVNFYHQVNSYLGLMSKFDSYKLRKKMLFSQSVNFYGLYMINHKLTKIILTKKGKNYV